jgi:hypothetical protein
MFKKAFMSHKNSPSATKEAQVRKPRMGWGEETVKPGDPTTSLVEAMVLDDAI